MQGVNGNFRGGKVVRDCGLRYLQNEKEVAMQVLCDFAPDRMA
jgi:hypothetical protein